MQKEIVLLTICLHQSHWEKVLLSSKSFTFIQKGSNCWAAQSGLWAFQPLVSQRSIFLKCFTKISYKWWPTLREEGPTWLSRNFLHVAASLAMPSKVQGSKNWIFISNFSACFLIVKWAPPHEGLVVIIICNYVCKKFKKNRA